MLHTTCSTGEPLCLVVRTCKIYQVPLLVAEVQQFVTFSVCFYNTLRRLRQHCTSTITTTTFVCCSFSFPCCVRIGFFFSLFSFLLQIVWCAGLHRFFPRFHCGSLIEWPKIILLYLLCVSLSRSFLPQSSSLVSLGDISTDTGCAGCRWVEISKKYQHNMKNTLQANENTLDPDSSIQPTLAVTQKTRKMYVFLFFPSYLLSSHYSRSLPVVTQIRGHIAALLPYPHHGTRLHHVIFAGILQHFFSLVDSRRIVPTRAARRSQQLILFLRLTDSTTTPPQNQRSI